MENQAARGLKAAARHHPSQQMQRSRQIVYTLAHEQLTAGATNQRRPLFQDIKRMFLQEQPQCKRPVTVIMIP